MYGEIFQVSETARKTADGIKFKDGDDSWSFAETHVFSIRKPGVAAAGFKLFYFHAAKPGPERRIWDELAIRGDIHIVRLGRQNAFASYVSEERARLTQEWHPKPDSSSYEAPVQLEINVAIAKRFIEKIANYDRRVADLARNHPIFSLDYEDLLADSATHLSGVLKFLNVSVESFEPAAFIEGSTSPGRTIIRNIDEVGAMLETEGKGWMLDPYR